MVIISELTQEQLTDCLKPFLKKQGFKKRQTTWRKTTVDLIYVLNIQGSQWNEEDYYINVAIYIKALGEEVNPPEYRCHIRNRIENELYVCSSICEGVSNWFEKYGDIEELRILWRNSELPLMVTVDAQNYLNESN
ncbi:DUF4304 domain-containing protein [Rossellomorea aquimaris]|uniref:DUF4304 domain-containing protein n=1 Tax=Rossellomorea aquimaris TaxID=189382 RepID=UPI001CD2A12E|nr:DUF4304 domain-containing protein [Rossellomorea aquimaris]MCA1057555.1 DUF4304 domain-containing protein [Rossellomorea aquimaris]